MLADAHAVGAHPSPQHVDRAPGVGLALVEVVAVAVGAVEVGAPLPRLAARPAVVAERGGTVLFLLDIHHPEKSRTIRKGDTQ